MLAGPLTAVLILLLSWHSLSAALQRELMSSGPAVSVQSSSATFIKRFSCALFASITQSSAALALSILTVSWVAAI